MAPFRTLLVILSTINFIHCLPITSKPIENTPEHLAWEAWIMIPPTQNKTRKITPKSIFILPDKTTNSQITCPPDHRIDNFKCIKTVQIDQQEIILNQFANIFSNTSYDYDYDYESAEEAHKLVGQPTNTVPSYNNNNGGPLKIDLLGQLPIETDDNKGSFDFGTSFEDGLNAQPFRSEASSSTATSSTTQASTSESDNSIPYFVAISTRPSSTTTATVASDSPIFSIQSLSSTTESSTSPRPATTTITTTSAVPLTSSTTATTNDKESGEDYDLIEEHTKRTSIPDGEIELVTEFAQTDLKQDLVKESLLVQSTHQPTTVEPSESTDSTEEPPTSVKESSLELVTTLTPPFATTPIRKYSFSNQNPQIMKATDDPYASKDFAGTTIQIQDEAEPIMESIENNNRFVYHHLGSTSISSTSKKPERSESRTPDVQEQLRIINKIVEENRKRAELGSKIKFPSDTFIQTDNLRADFIRFPEPTASRVITQTVPPPTRLFTDTKVIPILRQPSTVLTPTTSTTRIASTTTERQNTKPFWWLPSTWEVDRNGDRPLLLRFWSRASPTHSSPTTSGFRENSRSPTDNLYREISAHDVYNVLGARNWHHNTNEFT